MRARRRCCRKGSESRTWSCAPRPGRTSWILTNWFRGARALAAKVEEWRPRVLAFVGLGAYRTGFDRKKAKVGRQDEPIGGAEVWALPNPSGLNAHYQLPVLAELYGEAARAAGVL